MRSVNGRLLALSDPLPFISRDEYSRTLIGLGSQAKTLLRLGNPDTNARHAAKLEKALATSRIFEGKHRLYALHSLHMMAQLVLKSSLAPGRKQEIVESASARIVSLLGQPATGRLPGDVPALITAGVRSRNPDNKHAASRLLTAIVSRADACLIPPDMVVKAAAVAITLAKPGQDRNDALRQGGRDRCSRQNGPAGDHRHRRLAHHAPAWTAAGRSTGNEGALHAGRQQAGPQKS